MTSGSEAVATGVFGAILFTLVGAFAVFAFVSRMTTSARYARVFLVLVFLVSMCELPRYCCLIALARYTSRWAYGFHLVGTCFYFTTLSVVVHAVTHVVGILGGKQDTARRALHASNALFACLVLVAVGFLAGSSSLADFFGSRFFAAYSVIDATKNLVLVTVVGFAALARLWAVRKYARSLQNHTLEAQIRKIVFALAACCVCFLLRTIMICIKLVIVHHSSNDQIGDLTLYGFAWSFFGDFVPRTLPLLLFMNRFVKPRNGLAHKPTGTGTQQQDGRSLKQDNAAKFAAGAAGMA